MAYISKLYAGTGATPTATYDNIAQFFLDAGWTLHDNVGTRSNVYKSQGEEGVFPPGYLHLYLSSSTIYTIPYLYWNADTNTGTCYNYNTSYNYIAAGSVTSWYACYGNKDFILLVIDAYTSTSTSYVKLLGFIPAYFDETLTTTVSGISSGSNVDVPVTTVSGFVSGRRYQIVGSNYEGRELMTLNSVDSVNSVLNFASIAANYASGSYLGSKLGYFGGNVVTLTTDRPGSVIATNLTGTTNNTSSGDTYVNYLINFINTTLVDPEGRSQKYAISPLYEYEYTNQALLGYYDDYLFSALNIGNKGDIHGVVTTMQNYEFGTAESGTATTITDNDKAWTTNQWVNKIVVVAEGTGVGQTRVIGSNDATTLTLNGTNWITTPNGASMYYIVDEAYRKVTDTFVIREIIN